jgi:hypothetical protein
MNIHLALPLHRSVIVLAVAMLSPVATAAVTTYGSYEEWIANAGDTMAMTFADTGLPSGTLLTDQLANSGITFREDDSVRLVNGDFSGVDDKWIIQTFDLDVTTWIDFTEPITAVAVDTPQPTHSYQLWMDDVLVADLPETVFFFSGFVSDTPFNAIRIRKEGSSVTAVDNLFYSTIIPGPSGAALLGVASFFGVGRRRR